MVAICQLRIDFVLYERFCELALECSYPYQSKAVMSINRKLQSKYYCFTEMHRWACFVCRLSLSLWSIPSQGKALQEATMAPSRLLSRRITCKQWFLPEATHRKLDSILTLIGLMIQLIFQQQENLSKIKFWIEFSSNIIWQKKNSTRLVNFDVFFFL